MILLVQGLVVRAVAGVIATCETIPEALDALLPTIGSILDWDCGATWRFQARRQALCNVGFWRAPEASAPTFEAVTRAAMFAPGDGLPGRVWATATAHSIADVVADPNFPRATAARCDRLRGAYALPLRAGRDVVGVIEYFALEGRTGHEATSRTMDAIADGLGIVLHRRRPNNYSL